MQVVRIKSSFFDAGQEVWAGGHDYPVTDASMRQVELGNAEVVEVEDPPAQADQAAADVNEAPAGQDSDAAAAQGEAPAETPAGKQGGKRRNQA